MKKIVYMSCILILLFSTYSYGIEYSKDNNKNIELKELRISENGIIPDFNKNIYKYYLTIPSNVNNIKITAVPENENSVVEIIGNTDLDEGVNLITIKVNSEDKTQNQIYTIEVTKTDSIEQSNTNLENLAIQNILLNPPFAPNITNYEIEITNDITNLNILAIPQNENANINISGGKNLVEGENLIEIIVSSQNGISKKIYQINAYRLNDEETLKNKQAKIIEKEKLANLYTAEKTNIKFEKNNQNTESIIFYILILVFIITIVIIKIVKKK